MNPTQAIHGTPITAKRFLSQMIGASFCVSYYSPQQIEDVIPLLGPDSVLLLDNGAFSAWKKGLVLDEAYWDGYWTWAKAILDRVPQAIAVVPDVIGGTVEENARLIRELPESLWGYEDRLMVVWHLNEPLSYLRWMLESGFGNIAFGSAGEFASVGTAKWDARVDEAFGLIDELSLDLSHGIARPRVHMMRGLGQLKRGRHPFTTADSTNLARNHWKTKDQTNHIITFRTRIENDSFPAAPCAVWPQASWEMPRDMTVAQITEELEECKASLARTMADLDAPPPPSPAAPRVSVMPVPVLAVFIPVQLDLALPVVYHVPMTRSDDERFASYAARDTGRQGGRNARRKGGQSKERGAELPGMERSPPMDTGTRGGDSRGFSRHRAAMGEWKAGNTGTDPGSSPLYRPLRPD